SRTRRPRPGRPTFARAAIRSFAKARRPGCPPRRAAPSSPPRSRKSRARWPLKTTKTSVVGAFARVDAYAISRRPHEHVADAADGSNATRLLRIVSELLAEVAHVYVERSIDARIVRLALHRARELFTRDRAPRSSRERREQAKLERRERDLFSRERRL